MLHGRKEGRKEDGWGMTDRAGPGDRDTEYTDAPHGSYSGGDPHPSDSLDLRRLAQDWITLWQSELSAVAQDREAQETWRAMLTLLAGMAGAWLNGMPRADRGETPGTDERTGKRAGSEPAPRPKAAPAAPDPRDAEIERLARHVAALEARLAELEHGSHPRQPRSRKR